MAHQPIAEILADVHGADSGLEAIWPAPNEVVLPEVWF